MNTTIRACLLAVLAVTANLTYALDFKTRPGESFTEYFFVTPAKDDLLVLQVSGMAAQYSSFSFKVLSETGFLFNGKLSSDGGSVVATFNDPRNRTLPNLVGGKQYKIEVDGVTNPIYPGSFGILTASVGRTGTITPIPEPGEWALMISGLGLIGVMVRRRSRV